MTTLSPMYVQTPGSRAPRPLTSPARTPRGVAPTELVRTNSIELLRRKWTQSNRKEMLERSHLGWFPAWCARARARALGYECARSIARACECESASARAAFVRVHDRYVRRAQTHCEHIHIAVCGCRWREFLPRFSPHIEESYKAHKAVGAYDRYLQTHTRTHAWDARRVRACACVLTHARRQLKLAVLITLISLVFEIALVERLNKSVRISERKGMWPMLAAQILRQVHACRRTRMRMQKSRSPLHPPSLRC